MSRAFPVLLLVITACGTTPDAPERESLAAFHSCGELERHIKDEATRRMNAQIDVLMSGRGYSIDTAGAGVKLPDAAAPAAADYSTTNTQERGVDEADIVKNDGSRLFVLQAARLVILRAWPPEALHIESVTDLQDATSDEYYPSDLLLDGQTLVVFAVSASYVYFGPATDIVPVPARYTQKVRLSVFDVSGAAPVKRYDLSIDGGYLSARRSGHLVRLISSSTLSGPPLQYYPNGKLNWNDRAAVTAAFEALRSANLEKIRKSTLNDWLPAITEAYGAAAPHEVLRECSQIRAAGAPTSQGITTVSTVDLGHLSEGSSQTAVLSPADEVYASRAALYLTARRDPWADGAGSNEETRTFIHKFDTSERVVRYEASGSVPGTVADQFSLDEEGAFLRVATTRQAHWSGGTVLQPATSGVYVLHASQGTLSVTGQVTGLAAGETLYAARFLGPRGYLVTFRRVDPLFTLDLLRPSDPRVGGELKVPGFSTYLHALDERHLLTIGREASEDGRTQGGVLLEVFDVGDLQNPSLLHKLVLGTRYSSSEAGYEHKAFNFFASRSLLAIPYSNWAPGFRSYRSTVEVLRVTPQDGIQLVGSVDHEGLSEATHYPGWTPQVRRSVMMEDFVYSISSSGVKVNDTRAAMRTVAAVTLPQP